MIGEHLTLSTDAGGPRHFLAGRPVHCGDILELQEIERRVDDVGDEHIALVDRWVQVRYESQPDGQGGIVASLYAVVGGYVGTLRHWPSMRFRWPPA